MANKFENRQPSGFTFVPMASKSGKVSTRAKRQAGILNGASKSAVHGIAVSAKDRSMQRQAAQVVRASCLTIDDLYAYAEQGIALSADAWNDALALVAGELGSTHATARGGKKGCVELCEVAHMAETVKYVKAESGSKTQERSAERLDNIERVTNMVQTHLALSEAARLEAERAEAERAEAERVNSDAEVMEA